MHTHSRAKRNDWKNRQYVSNEHTILIIKIKTKEEILDLAALIKKSDSNNSGSAMKPEINATCRFILKTPRVLQCRAIMLCETMLNDSCHVGDN